MKPEKFLAQFYGLADPVFQSTGEKKKCFWIASTDENVILELKLAGCVTTSIYFRNNVFVKAT